MRVVRLAILCGVTGLLTLLPAIAHASGWLTLAWDANGESNLAGYVIHYGTSSGAYTTQLDVGDRTWYTVEGLVPGQTYYFAVKAYNTSGRTSRFSLEVSGRAVDCALLFSTSAASFASSGTSGTTGVAVLNGCSYADDFTYYLAEGATGPFELDIAIANPNQENAPVTIRFLKEDGTTVLRREELPPTSQRVIRVNHLPGIGEGAVSAIVRSDGEQPLIVERTMFWGTAGHTEAAAGSPAYRWYFAEGSQGFFETFILVANATAGPATVDVSFLREAAGPITRRYIVAGTSRFNIYTGAIPELRNQSFSVVIDADRPIIAERAQYFGSGWTGGHESAGVRAPATRWFHAEGATGSYFDTFILVANPNPIPAAVEFQYLLASGDMVTRSRVMAPHSRLTVNIAADDPRLRDAAVSTVVTADIPVISERSMYWPGHALGWREAHNSFGVTATGTRWGLAEGRVGGSRRFETFILLANPSPTTALVRVTYLRWDGSTIQKDYTVLPTSRFNVHVNSMVPELADETFGTIVESLNDVPLAVERALYFNNWLGGTNAAATPLP
jgi:hypothetical protein